MRPLLALVTLAFCTCALGQRQLYALRKSDVSFISNAPMERISAGSRSATGILDMQDREFVVRIPIRSFTGFNSPVQQEHFQENYLESDQFPNAVFEGRIIEAVDLAVPGTYKVRAKGRFTVHGMSRDRLIPCQVVVEQDGLRVTAVFNLTLAEYAIRIPRVVQQKLAATVQVKVDLLFRPAPVK